ncbi:hypothetical protein ACFRFQ_15290 [Rhodococcus sp. NPDC056743]|uniref:hypothetical protein n=1 Tax=Rhodococcus sp. NPDC056743 TaxID=3345934 RepID=UPI00366D58BD
MNNQRGRTKIYAAAVAVASFTAFAGAAPAAATDDDNGEATTAQTTAESPTTTESATASESAPATTSATSSATSETTTAAATTTTGTTGTTGTTTPSVATKSTPVWNSPTDGIAAGGREYSVSPGTVTVYYPDGQSAAMGQHINLDIRNPETGEIIKLGTHIDGNGQWTEKYIGQSPWVLDISSHPNFPGWDNFEIVWVQVDGQNYHYGEHGEPPMPSDPKTPETTTSTTTPVTTTTIPEGPTPPITTQPTTPTVTTTTEVTTTEVPTTTTSATTTATTEPTTTTPATSSSAVSTPSATSIPTTTTRVVVIPPIIVGIPKIDGSTPAPTTGPSKEPVYVVTTPEGYEVHGYDDPQGTFVPLAYDDALVFQTGASESTGPSGVVIAGVGGAALLVSAAGAFALRRKNVLRQH